MRAEGRERESQKARTGREGLACKLCHPSVYVCMYVSTSALCLENRVSWVRVQPRAELFKIVFQGAVRLYSATWPCFATLIAIHYNIHRIAEHLLHHYVQYSYYSSASITQTLIRGEEFQECHSQSRVCQSGNDFTRTNGQLYIIHSNLLYGSFL